MSRLVLASTFAACSAGLQVAAGLVDAIFAVFVFMLLTAVTAAAAAWLGAKSTSKKRRTAGKNLLLFQQNGMTY
ncbi:hypothetical protein [Amycolatopsis thermoflava]|uniref:hypothetical protein n=1 Tax=Amycolatopsis thermoflava TaxID=84480 RepID=UPI0012FA44FE|nr:hypothetical protein [Amycolatopsis thermoflava]